MSWIQAPTFKRYMGSGYNSKNWTTFKKNVRAGDFIGYDAAGDGNLDHVGYVVEKSGTAIKIAQHSTDYLKWDSSTSWSKVGSKAKYYQVAMNRREMAWKLVRIMSWTPALLLLFLYTYIPRYGISTDAWSDAIGFTCMVCVFIIPVAFSVFLVIAPMIMSDGCSRYWIAATIRILSALALIAYFPHSYELWIYYQAWRTGKELWLDTSFEMNPQGYTTVALVSCLVTYLIGKILFDRHERTEMTRDT